MKIASGSQMAEIDKKTIEEIGIPGSVLMENAARCACRALQKEIGEDHESVITFLCGSGNNGGDGFCMARIMKEWGHTVQVIHIGRTQSLKETALLNYRLLEKFGIRVMTISEEKDLHILNDVIENSNWLVDAIFGTGLSRPVLGISARVLEICGKFHGRILSVDIPSGINSDTGEATGPCISADMTVTFGLPKWGHFIYPGTGHAGKLLVADIGIPRSLTESDAITGNLTTADYVSKRLPERPLNAHKGSCGKLAIVAGSRSMMGAGILVCRSALRMGTGYVTLMLPNYLEPLSKIALPDVVTLGLTDMDGGFVTAQASEVVIHHLKDKTALAIGPGLSQRGTSRDFVLNILEDSKIPTVIDADALNHIAGDDSLKRDSKVSWIMTPHAGEAGRLLKIDTQEVIDKPLESALAISKKYHAVVVLKGPNTIISNTDGQVFVNTTGNPGMAVLGMGDTLTGIIASLLSREVNAFEAAVCGTYIHGLSGDIMAEKLSMESLTASDMADGISLAIRALKSEEVKDRIELIR